MSPPVRAGKPQSRCFPRVSGDEPTKQPTDRLIPLFSPRERG